MARYGQQFEDKAVARLLSPGSSKLSAPSLEAALCGERLESWPSSARVEPARERAWTAAARVDAVATTTSREEAAKGFGVAATVCISGALRVGVMPPSRAWPSRMKQGRTGSTGRVAAGSRSSSANGIARERHWRDRGLPAATKKLELRPLATLPASSHALDDAERDEIMQVVTRGKVAGVMAAALTEEKAGD